MIVRVIDQMNLMNINCFVPVTIYSRFQYNKHANKSATTKSDDKIKLYLLIADDIAKVNLLI